jgi:hypothetical protein
MEIKMRTDALNSAYEQVDYAAGYFSSLARTMKTSLGSFYGAEYIEHLIDIRRGIETAELKKLKTNSEAASSMATTKKEHILTTAICPSSAAVLIPPDRLFVYLSSMMNAVGNGLRAFGRWLTDESNRGYEEWNRLEFRNEFATRTGERMNPFCIR